MAGWVMDIWHEGMWLVILPKTTFFLSRNIHYCSSAFKEVCPVNLGTLFTYPTITLVTIAFTIHGSSLLIVSSIPFNLIALAAMVSLVYFV